MHFCSRKRKREPPGQDHGRAREGHPVTMMRDIAHKFMALRTIFALKSLTVDWRGVLCSQRPFTLTKSNGEGRRTPLAAERSYRKPSRGTAPVKKFSIRFWEETQCVV